MSSDSSTEESDSDEQGSSTSSSNLKRDFTDHEDSLDSDEINELNKRVKSEHAYRWAICACIWSVKKFVYFLLFSLSPEKMAEQIDTLKSENAKLAAKVKNMKKRINRMSQKISDMKDIIITLKTERWREMVNMKNDWIFRSL